MGPQEPGMKCGHLNIQYRYGSDDDDMVEDGGYGVGYDAGYSGLSPVPTPKPTPGWFDAPTTNHDMNLAAVRSAGKATDHDDGSDWWRRSRLPLLCGAVPALCGVAVLFAAIARRRRSADATGGAGAGDSAGDHPHSPYTMYQLLPSDGCRKEMSPDNSKSQVRKSNACSIVIDV